MSLNHQNLSLANLRLGAFYIEGMQIIPDGSSLDKDGSRSLKLISGHFELIKDVRGSDSAWGYKRLQINCTYQISLNEEGELKLVALNLCPEGVIMRLTAANLTDFRIDKCYTLADLSERCQHSIQLNHITDFIDPEVFERYLHGRKELLQSYVDFKEAS